MLKIMLLLHSRKFYPKYLVIQLEFLIKYNFLFFILLFQEANIDFILIVDKMNLKIFDLFINQFFLIYLFLFLFFPFFLIFFHP